MEFAGLFKETLEESVNVCLYLAVEGGILSSQNNALRKSLLRLHWDSPHHTKPFVPGRTLEIFFTPWGTPAHSGSNIGKKLTVIVFCFMHLVP